MTFGEFVRAWQPAFPRLTEENSRRTSPSDEGYNCIAWAAQDIDRWWWPDPQNQYFWPPEVRREVTLDAFVQAYGLQGYVERSDATLEPGKQKIAIYTTEDGKPTHASRQLSGGWWASKLGENIDIEHEFTALDGPAYGSVAQILARSAR